MDSIAKLLLAAMQVHGPITPFRIRRSGSLSRIGQGCVDCFVRLISSD